MIQHQSSLDKKLELGASNISYQLLNKIVNATGKVTLTQKTNETIFFKINGQNLTLQTKPYNQLNMSGAPLILIINSQDQAPMKATAEKISYDQNTQIFEISGNVNLATERENISANKIIYNHQTRVLQIPKSLDQQVEMTQTKSTIEKDTHD